MIEILQSLGIWNVLVLLATSAAPILELRGGILAGVAMGMPAWETFIICVIGNMLPVPFIILLWKRFLKLFKKGKFKELLDKIQRKADTKKDLVQKYEILGLYIFVAIPFPGTGAWTGSLIAATLDIPLKRAILPIFAGVLTAGVIMTIIGYGGGAVLASIFGIG